MKCEVEDLVAIERAGRFSIANLGRVRDTTELEIDGFNWKILLIW